ncbi:hypothetical protein BJN34_01400 [Cupriavidus necator]|uniref:Carboxymuconolactone decarboxylase-like domain-containing protein n=1 Tax=Cupriavidus necator TaxID=106590 RepID=A0A1U9UIY5_CUPNE|nr:carboxymuconolactone decarboxylase family protein [Cupriavidus necator]AQV92548.1 hypothetical protein BJN34_01400 [Cupriavidus necator]
MTPATNKTRDGVGFSPCITELVATPAGHAVNETDALPAMNATMAGAPALAAVYQNCYSALRKDSTLTVLEQGVVLFVLAAASGCNYDVVTYGEAGNAVSSTFRKITAAIRAGKPLTDARLRVLVSFTRAMFIHRGRPSDYEVKTFLNAGYREENIQDIILAIATNTLSAYTSHVFHAQADASAREVNWVAVT